MSKAAWIQTLLQRRSLWLAGVACVLLLLLGSVVLSQRDWRDRAWGLERARSAFRPAQPPRPPGLLARLSRLLGRLVGKPRSTE